MVEKLDNRSGNARAQIITALIATIPTFTYGIQIGWLSPMAPILKSNSTNHTAHLSDSDITWMATALPWAAICGIPFFSFASDKIGRKYCIIAVSLFSCICWILKLTAVNATGFIAARIMAGLAASGALVVVPVYIKEIATDSWRGALSSLVMTMCKVGVITVYALGMFLTYNANQAVYLAIAGAHAVIFFFMPESPNFLIKKGKEDQAANTIAWLRGLRNHDQAIVDEMAILKEENRRITAMPKITLRTLVRDRPTFGALRMTLVLMGMQTLSGCFALMNYAADVFDRAGTSWSPNTLALFMGSLQLAGSFFTTVSIEKFGRKLPLGFSSLVVCVCMTTLATCFVVWTPEWVPAAAVCACIFAYGAGLAPVPFVLMAEVFSFDQRARMAGISMAFSFFCSSMTVLLYTPVANLVGPFAVFYAFGAVGLFGLVYTILYVPETKGKSLKEIQAHWGSREQKDFISE